MNPLLVLILELGLFGSHFPVLCVSIRDAGLERGSDWARLEGSNPMVRDIAVELGHLPEAVQDQGSCDPSRKGC